MDINLLELSLQNQMTEEGSDEMEIRRIESFSPELEKLNQEQNFKINYDL
jgi:hypothetical protein